MTARTSEPLPGPIQGMLVAFPAGLALYEALTAALLLIGGAPGIAVLYGLAAVLAAVAAGAAARRMPRAPGLVFAAGLALAAIAALGTVVATGGLVSALEALMGLSTAFLGAGILLTRRGGPSRARRRRRERERS